MGPENKLSFLLLQNSKNKCHPRAHPGFSQGGGGDKFSHVRIVPSRVQKSTLRKLFTMLQVFSVLTHSKKFQKTDFKDANHAI